MTTLDNVVRFPGAPELPSVPQATFSDEAKAWLRENGKRIVSPALPKGSKVSVAQAKIWEKHGKARVYFHFRVELLGETELVVAHYDEGSNSWALKGGASSIIEKLFLKHLQEFRMEEAEEEEEDVGDPTTEEIDAAYEAYVERCRNQPPFDNGEDRPPRPSEDDYFNPRDNS